MSDALIAQTPLVGAAPRTDAGAATRAPTDWRTGSMRGRVRRRYAAERRFRIMSAAAVVLSVAFLAFLLVSMIGQGARGFTQTELRLPVDGAALRAAAAPGADAGALETAVNEAAEARFGAGGARLLSDSAWIRMREQVGGLGASRQELWVPAATGLDLAAKGDGDAEDEARVAALERSGALRTGFNANFLSGADASDPTAAGIWGALGGSLLTMLVTFLLAFPIGVLSAVYLEEYAPRNRWTDLIEVSINNLAAVPSIIFGLLGLAVFLNTMHLPRSAPLVGGLTLALMTMPVIVIAARNAIKAVPPSIRDAALGVGSSPVQVVSNHVLPLALPGILTGTIIGMSRALGETAPLLLIGMRAFIAAPPRGVTDPATALPVQIFLWSDEVSRGFVEKTSAAILVLLVFLLAMNGIAIYLRNRFETRW